MSGEAVRPRPLACNPHKSKDPVEVLLRRIRADLLFLSSSALRLRQYNLADAENARARIVALKRQVRELDRLTDRFKEGKIRKIAHQVVRDFG